ncbi:MAG TPA: PAS domain S-box protein [Candidatus Methanoperedens sp.]
MNENESSKLKALSDIASIEITLEFADILNQILSITCETMNAHSGTIMLVNEVTKQLEMVSSYGLPSEFIDRVYELSREFNIPISTSPSGVVLETGKYYLVPNVFEESRLKTWVSLAKEAGFSSQIFIPMKKGSKVIGLLNVYNAQVHDFTDEEIDFANIAASQASSVVQNSRVCSRLRKNIIELKDYEQHLQEKIKESHKKLFESEAKFRDLFENAQYPMYVVDTEGNFLKMNKVGLQTLGFTREEFIGINISKLVTQESLTIVKERQKKRLRKEPVNQTCIIEVICKNGEHLWIEANSRDIKKGDTIIEIQCIAKDITENIKLKKELNKSNNQRKLLCHLIEGSRGGNTRAKILKCLTEKSYNANQMAEALNMDYKTIRHHLKVLIKNGIITKNNDGSVDLYNISKNMELDFNDIYQKPLYL